MGGAASEMVFVGHRAPMFASNDVPHAREIAEMVCRTSASVAAFIEHGYQEALQIIETNKPIVLALARALIEHPAQTLNGAEIDQIIADTVDREARKAEIKRRANWKLVEQNAGLFPADGIQPRTIELRR
jgi:ATP-dependent Zn protease